MRLAGLYVPYLLVCESPPPFSSFFDFAFEGGVEWSGGGREGGGGAEQGLG